MSDLENLAFQPILPPEIEHLIIKMVTEEIVFPLIPKPGATHLNIQLIAKRFRDWVMLAIFRVLDRDTIRLYVGAAGATYFMDHLIPVYGKATMHIMCRMGSREDEIVMQSLIKAAPNLQDLAFWPLDARLTYIHSSIENYTKLGRLSAGFRGVPPEIIRCPVYMNLTHLELIGEPYLSFDALACFQSLVHLCVSFEDSNDWEETLTKLTEPETSPYQSLRFITGIYDENTDATAYVNELFVAIYVHDVLGDWFGGANGDMDSWEFSKRIIVARNRGYTLHLSKDRIYTATHFDIASELNAEGQKWWLQNRNRKIQY
ncbi:hypothetical protein BJ165DRAFT_1456644 [Panaeolus papilionaceus]|nr:hypothetical protein BJ165DRAFT_1456644 [Panaeolus papilionaceus]